jgi:hypothetical protein
MAVSVLHWYGNSFADMALIHTFLEVLNSLRPPYMESPVPEWWEQRLTVFGDGYGLGCQ